MDRPGIGTRTAANADAGIEIHGQKDEVGEASKRAEIDRCREAPLAPETR